MADKTVKNAFDDGYTTYHDDGTKSKTYKNAFSDGYTTYHSDGSKSKTYDKVLSDGKTTYHSDGSKSDTYKNAFRDGYTTYHSDGSKSTTYKSTFSDGYTTVTIGKPSGRSGDFSGDGYSGGKGSSADGGLGGIVIPIIIIVPSFLSMLLLKNGIFYFGIFIASAVLRIWLNNKYNTTLFALWFYPFSLLSWRLLVDSFWAGAENADSFVLLFAGFGTLFFLLGIAATLYIDCGENILLGTYCFVMTICMFFAKAYGNDAPYILLGCMLLVALVFTPSLLKKIRKE